MCGRTEARISCNSPELNELHDQMQNMQKQEPRHCDSMPVRGNFRGAMPKKGHFAIDFGRLGN